MGRRDPARCSPAPALRGPRGHLTAGETVGCTPCGRKAYEKLQVVCRTVFRMCCLQSPGDAPEGGAAAGRDAPRAPAAAGPRELAGGRVPEARRRYAGAPASGIAVQWSENPVDNILHEIGVQTLHRHLQMLHCQSLRFLNTIGNAYKLQFCDSGVIVDRFLRSL